MSFLPTRRWSIGVLLALGAAGCAGLIGADFDRSLASDAGDDDDDDDDPKKKRDGGSPAGDDDGDDDAPGDAAAGDASLLAAECGDLGGLDPGAPWPMGGYCPTRASQTSARSLKSPKILWRFDLGDQTHTFYSTPAIAADGSLFVPAFLGVDGGGLVFAIVGIKDRKETFRAALPGNGGPSTPVLASNGALIVQTMGAVTSLNRAGAIQWTHPTSATSFGEPVILPSGDIVVLNDDSFDFIARTSGNGIKVAPAFGAPFAFAHSIAVSPRGKLFAVARPTGGASLDGRLVAVNASKQLLFAAPIVLNGSPTGSPAIDVNGNIVVHTTNGIAIYSDTGALIDFKTASTDPKAPFLARSGSTFWWSREGPGGPVSYDTTSMKLVTHPDEGVLSPWSVVTDGSLLVVRRAVGATPPSALIAKAPDGTERWKVALDPSPEAVLAPAVDKDGTIYVALGRTLYAIGVP